MTLRQSRISTLVAGFLALLILPACARPLPRYHAMEPRDAIRTMRERDSAIESVSVECNVSIQGKDASSVSLDAVLVAKWPDYLRIRAWKFGHPAFDLTSTPDGVWLYVSDEARERSEDRADFSVSGEQFQRAWGLLGPAFLREEGLTWRSERGKLILRRPAGSSLEGGAVIECEVNEETLTTDKYLFIDADGRIRQTITLGSYRISEPGSIVWPRVFAAEGDSGGITIRLGEPEFNGELSAEAFVPPKRARKLP